MAILRRLNTSAPEGSSLRSYRSSDRELPNRVPITDDLLWVMGFYLAEGGEYSGPKGHFSCFASDEGYLHKAKAILEASLGVHVGYSPPTPGRASIYVHSKALHRLFRDVLGLRNKRVPGWVMQLPLDRVKHFLEGLGAATALTAGRRSAMNWSSTRPPRAWRST